jgi:tetratricopeptide (TPR) repeat protein
MSKSNVPLLIAESHLAFLGQQGDKALSLARQAIALDSANPEAHKHAGDALLALGRGEEAVKAFALAASHDPKNGNRYYDLGFAQVSTHGLVEAMKSLAKAHELGCSPQNTALLYSLLGVICLEMGSLDDALTNLDKAEEMLGFDIDILKRKAALYGMRGSIRKGLQAANKIKLFNPTNYLGYQIAFKLELQAGLIQAAQKELELANRYAVITMAFYEDLMALGLEMYRQSGERGDLQTAISALAEGLRATKPSLSEVIDAYINAAELYLQLEEPDLALGCLNASQNAAWSFNAGFEIVPPGPQPPEMTEYDVADMIEADRERIAEVLGEHGLEELVEGTEMNEDGSRDYLTDIVSMLGDMPQEEEEEEEVPYRLDEDAPKGLDPDKMNQVNSLYIGVYTQEGDLQATLGYAGALQASKDPASVYLGIYSEAKALKALGKPEAEQAYEDAIKAFKRATIVDSSDFLAVTYRIRCLIDTGDLAGAHDLCSLLTQDLRAPLLKMIEKLSRTGQAE